MTRIFITESTWLKRDFIPRLLSADKGIEIARRCTLQQRSRSRRRSRESRAKLSLLEDARYFEILAYCILEL